MHQLQFLSIAMLPTCLLIWSWTSWTKVEGSWTTRSWTNLDNVTIDERFPIILLEFKLYLRASTNVVLDPQVTIFAVRHSKFGQVLVPEVSTHSLRHYCSYCFRLAKVNLQVRISVNCSERLRQCKRNFADHEQLLRYIDCNVNRHIESHSELL